MLCMPPNLSYLFQPLDIDCFNPLKILYRKEIKGQIRLGINYIIREEFLSVYYQVYITAITKKNIRNGFRATGLVLYNLDQILFILNPII